MKVKDLIENLSKFDPETMVVVSGYEGGYTEKLGVCESELSLNVRDELYYGVHDESVWFWEEVDAKHSKANAVIIYVE